MVQENLLPLTWWSSPKMGAETDKPIAEAECCHMQVDPKMSLTTFLCHHPKIDSWWNWDTNWHQNMSTKWACRWIYQSVHLIVIIHIATLYACMTRGITTFVGHHPKMSEGGAFWARIDVMSCDDSHITLAAGHHLKMSEGGHWAYLLVIIWRWVRWGWSCLGTMWCNVTVTLWP